MRILLYRYRTYKYCRRLTLGSLKGGVGWGGVGWGGVGWGEVCEQSHVQHANARCPYAQGSSVDSVALQCLSCKRDT